MVIGDEGSKLAPVFVARLVRNLFDRMGFRYYSPNGLDEIEDLDFILNISIYFLINNILFIT